MSKLKPVRRGRPSVPQAKRTTLGIRVSPDLLARIQRRQLPGERISETVRRLLEGATRQ